MKILIAADNPLAQVILRQSLEALGHVATVVTEGGAAWERLQSDDFPLVISDWVLPDVNGLELCRRIRARDDGPAYTYVILLTDKTERDDRVEGYEAGADDFLSQPLDRGELLARVGVARRILTMQEELRRRSRQLELMHAELQRQYARLAEVAVSDGLTGLKNRRHFRECLETSFSFSCRKKLVLSVVMLDVDHFKHYNDTFGHPAGDAALAELGRLLRDNAREPDDLVARYGGEEFVILSVGDQRRVRHALLRTLPRDHCQPSLAAPTDHRKLRRRHEFQPHRQRPATRRRGRPRPLPLQEPRAQLRHSLRAVTARRRLSVWAGTPTRRGVSHAPGVHHGIVNDFRSKCSAQFRSV